MKKDFNIHRLLVLAFFLFLSIGQCLGQTYMYSRPSVSTEPDLCDQGRGKATLYISPDLEAECTIRWEWGWE